MESKTPSDNKLPFGKKNYRWMIIGVITLILGFIIMSLDSEVHGFRIHGAYAGTDRGYGGVHHRDLRHSYQTNGIKSRQTGDSHSYSRSLLIAGAVFLTKHYVFTSRYYPGHY